MQQHVQNWETTKIGNIADVTKLAGYEFTQHVKYIENGKIIALRALNLTDGSLNLSDIKRIDESVSNTLKRSKLYSGDILLSYTGTVGNFALVKENDKFHLAPNVCRIRTNSKCIPKFLFFYFRTKLFKSHLLGYSHGSSQSTVPMKNIREIPVLLPPIEVQQKIVSILSVIDDKIELNNKIAKTLEEMAQAIFKEWFVNFRFPGYEDVDFIEYENGIMPKDWEVASIYDIANFINGKTFKDSEFTVNGLPIIKIAELKNGISKETKFTRIDYEKKYLIGEKDILFSWSGNPETSIDIFIWNKKEAWLNQHIFKVDPKSFNKGFVYFMLKYFLKQFVLIAKNKQTTGLGHVTVADLKSMKIVLPKNMSSLVAGFETLENIFNQIYLMQKSNNKLLETRDSILPKLMKGETTV